jgi:hypothetical protein
VVKRRIRRRGQIAVGKEEIEVLGIEDAKGRVSLEFKEDLNEGFLG